MSKENISYLDNMLALYGNRVFSIRNAPADAVYIGRDRVPFIAEIPDYKQPSRWPYRSREKWSALMQYADRVNQYAPQNKGRSYAYILNQRNIGMIAACDILIAVYNGDATGGTANGVRDGRRLDKWIVTIPPQSI